MKDELAEQPEPETPAEPEPDLCPGCGMAGTLGQPLEVEGAQAVRQCSGCGKAFPVPDDIPF
jgi:hypothetical protein